ncbi:MAG: MerR family transcriptional regulator [Minicystis sp.]
MADDLTIADLAREADILPRAVRYYLERGLLPRPAFKSRNTRYGREHLIRLRAIVRLRKTGMLIDAIRKKLASMPHEELLALAGMDASKPPAFGSTMAQAKREPPAGAARPLPEGFVGPYRATLATPSERWEHVAICPGVVLMVRGEADAESWRVAREIVATFGGASPR